MAELLESNTFPIESRQAIDPAMMDQTVLRPKSAVQSSIMEGETVLLDLSTGRYYTLNRLGSVIWEHCAGGKTISEIHAVLCARFSVASEQALDDLVALVSELLHEGLLQQERR